MQNNNSNLNNSKSANDKAGEFMAWNYKKIKLDNRKLKPQEVNRGEVFWFSLGVNIGKEINGKSENFTRPCYIYKIINKTTYLVIPLTTSEYYKDKWHLKVEIPGMKNNFLCFNQIRIVDYRRIKKLLFTLNDLEIQNIENEFEKLFIKKDAVTSSVTGDRDMRSGASAGAPNISIAQGDILSNRNNKIVVILIGPSCAGKSTVVAEIFKLKNNFFHLKFDSIKRLFVDYDPNRDIQKVIDLLTVIGKDRISRGDNILIESWYYDKSLTDFALSDNYKLLKYNIEAPLDVLLERFKLRLIAPIPGIKINISEERFVEIYNKYLEVKKENEEIKVFDSSKITADKIASEIYQDIK